MAGFLDSIFNPWLLPLISANPFWGIIGIALAISFLITLIYKLVTDQDKMRGLKEKQKDFQARMKSLRDKPDEMMKVQKEAMSVNMEYMKQSFKPTLITMIPILLIFGWLAAHLTYEPIYPDERFSISAEVSAGVDGQVELIVDEDVEVLSDRVKDSTGELVWNLKASGGEHFIGVKTANDEQTKKILITDSLEYEDPVSSFENSEVASITINYKELKPLGDFSIFGWRPGWLGWYIIFSIIFSIGIRKLMKVY